VRQIEWTEQALEDMAALDKALARRVRQALRVLRVRKRKEAYR